jgi:hypothetical protein
VVCRAEAHRAGALLIRRRRLRERDGLYAHAREAPSICSPDDIAPDITGTQNAWIQGVGCASAVANFSS